MNKHFKTIVICIAVIIAAGVSASAETRDPALRWEKTIKSFVHRDKQNTTPKNAVLFVGSSSIRMWETQTAFPKYKVINRGFGGAQVSDVNYYIDKIVLPYKPKLIVFYCGDNDIAVGKTPQTVLDDYKQFVKMARKGNPKVKIVYIAIKPSKSRWKLWPKMQKANKMIAEFCQNGKKLHFVDTSVKLIGEDGKPDDKYFLNDKLHLSDTGYKTWNGMIKPFLKKCRSAKK